MGKGENCRSSDGKEEKEMKRFRYSFHNIVGHPLMEVLYVLGFHAAGSWVHDATLPRKKK